MLTYVLCNGPFAAKFTDMKPFCPAAERKGLFISVGETMEMMICSVK